MPSPDAKKAKSNKLASKETVWPKALGEGTLTKTGDVLGPGASMAEKILVGVILPADKEKVDKLSLDQVVTKFFHIVGQVFFHFHLLLSFYFLLIHGTQRNSFVAGDRAWVFPCYLKQGHRE